MIKYEESEDTKSSPVFRSQLIVFKAKKYKHYKHISHTEVNNRRTR